MRTGTRRRAVLIGAVAWTALAFWLIPGATPASPPAAKSGHWAIEVAGDWASGLTSKGLKQLRLAHVGTIVVPPSSVRLAQQQGVVARARAAGFLVVLPRVARGRTNASNRPVLRGCSGSQRRLLTTCALEASSPTQAVELAQLPGLGAIVVRVRSLFPIAGIAARTLRTPLIVLAPASDHGDNREQWIGAMRAAARQPLLWLGVRHSSGAVISAIRPFTSAIGAVLSTDTTPPPAPSRLTVTTRTSSSITVDWSASTDPGGQVSYGIYRDGERIDSTVRTSYTLAGLVCGTALTVAVDAADAAGNRSAKAVTSTQTVPCGGGGGGGGGGWRRRRRWRRRS